MCKEPNFICTYLQAAPTIELCWVGKLFLLLTMNTCVNGDMEHTTRSDDPQRQYPQKRRYCKVFQTHFRPGSKSSVAIDLQEYSKVQEGFWM